MQRFRIFGSHLGRAERRVYGAVVGFYVVAGLATLWPIYPLFGGARPLVLGLPLSLFSLVALLVGSFVVQLALLTWESRRGVVEPPEEDECPPG